jgi:uncharacterized membrane protein YtjA (UPF0391 family)
MIGWAITFLVIALIAALLGFGGIAGVAIEAAKIVFFVAIVLRLLSESFADAVRRSRRENKASKNPGVRMVRRGFAIRGRES